jgi:hypothetical protein
MTGVWTSFERTAGGLVTVSWISLLAVTLAGLDETANFGPKIFGF